MFEVVAAERRAHPARNRPEVVVGSIAFHALMVVAIAYLPTRPPPAPIDLEQEMATFLDVLSRVPDLPALPRGEGAGAGGPTASAKAVSAPPSSAVALDKISLELPDVGEVLPSANELGAVDAGAFGAFEGARGMGGVEGSGVDGGGVGEGGAGGDIVHEGALAERPQVINRFEMEELWQRLYPPIMNLKGIAGDVVVSFVVDAQGRVEPQTIRIVSSSHPEFIVATIAGVKRLRFKPAKLNGSPVRVRAMIPVHWRPLEG